MLKPRRLIPFILLSAIFTGHEQDYRIKMNSRMLMKPVCF
jgi:hypothetical protein